MKLQEEFHISTDKSLLDLELIHHFLQDAYWSKNIPIDIVEKSIENSVCFGVYNAAEQIGFARVVTDFATFAYLGDVFILEPFQGLGLAKWLMKTIMAYPDLSGLRRWMLVTKDAQLFYEKFGFVQLKYPDYLMEISDPDIYSRENI